MLAAIAAVVFIVAAAWQGFSEHDFNWTTLALVGLALVAGHLYGLLPHRTANH